MSDTGLEQFDGVDLGTLLDRIESGAMASSVLTFAAEKLGSYPIDSRIEVAIRVLARHHDPVVREGVVLAMIAAEPRFDADLRLIAATDKSAGVRMVAAGCAP